MEFWLLWELFRLLNKKLLFSFAYIMPESIQISFGFVVQVCIYILLSADRKLCVDHLLSSTLFFVMAYVYYLFSLWISTSLTSFLKLCCNSLILLVTYFQALTSTIKLIFTLSTEDLSLIPPSSKSWQAYFCLILATVLDNTYHPYGK